jgi:hypothetical protein
VWLRAGEPLVCPNGHRLRHNAAVLQHEAFICGHTQPGQRGECGARCYVLSMPGGLRFVAEVTVAEMLHMRDAHMGVPEVLAYLQGSAA